MEPYQELKKGNIVVIYSDYLGGRNPEFLDEDKSKAELVEYISTTPLLGGAIQIWKVKFLNYQSKDKNNDLFTRPVNSLSKIEIAEKKKERLEEEMKNLPVKKAKAVTVSTGKRGRPKKVVDESIVVAPKKGRGRPRKTPLEAVTVVEAETVVKRRGRPRKAVTVATMTMPVNEAPRKGRGRPPLSPEERARREEALKLKPKGKRGRPSGSKNKVKD